MGGHFAVLIGLSLFNAVDHPSYGVGVDGLSPGRGVGGVAGDGGHSGAPTREHVGVLSVGSLDGIGMAGHRAVGVLLNGLLVIDDPGHGVHVGGVDNVNGDVALDGAGNDRLIGGVALDDGAGHAVSVTDGVLLLIGGSGGGAVGIGVGDGQGRGLSYGEVDLTGDVGYGGVIDIRGGVGGIGMIHAGEDRVHRQIGAGLIGHDALCALFGNSGPLEVQTEELAALLETAEVEGHEVHTDHGVHVALNDAGYVGGVGGGSRHVDVAHEGGNIGILSVGCDILLDESVNAAGEGGVNGLNGEISLILIYVEAAADETGSLGNGEIPREDGAFDSLAGVLLLTGEGHFVLFGLGLFEVDLAGDIGDVVVLELVGVVGGIGMVYAAENGVHRQVGAGRVGQDAFAALFGNSDPLEVQTEELAALLNAAEAEGAEVHADHGVHVAGHELVVLGVIFRGGFIVQPGHEGGGIGILSVGCDILLDESVNAAGEGGIYGLNGEIVLIVVYVEAAAVKTGILGNAEIPGKGVVYVDLAGVLLLTGEGDVHGGGLGSFLHVLVEVEGNALSGTLCIRTEFVVGSIIADAAVARSVGRHSYIGIGIEGDGVRICGGIRVYSIAAGVVPADVAVNARLLIEHGPGAVRLLLKPPDGVGVGIDDDVLIVDGDIGSAHPLRGAGAVQRLGGAVVGGNEHVILIGQIFGAVDLIEEHILLCGGSRGLDNGAAGNVDVGVIVIGGDVGIIGIDRVAALVGNNGDGQLTRSGDSSPPEPEPAKIAARLNAVIFRADAERLEPGVGVAGSARGIAAGAAGVGEVRADNAEIVALKGRFVAVDLQMQLGILLLVCREVPEETGAGQIVLVIVDKNIERIERGTFADHEGPHEGVADLRILLLDDGAREGHRRIDRCRSNGLAFIRCEHIHRYECEYHECRNDEAQKSFCHCSFPPINLV